MKILIAAALLVAAAPGLRGQDTPATMYGRISPNFSSAQGRVLILQGGADDQLFLKGMAASQKIGTFICDNFDTQSSKSSNLALSADSSFAWNMTSSVWPVNVTIVACGTVSLSQSYRHDMVDTQFKFAAWGSAIAYPGLKQQVPPLNYSYVDYCPQNTSNCDTSFTHPEPPMPTHTAHVAGRVGAHDCSSGAELTDGMVQVVLDSTEEGREFNNSPETARACDKIPAFFQQNETSVREDLDITSGNAKVRYSIDVPITGRDVWADVYVCATADIHKGLDSDNCDDDTTEIHFWKKSRIMLEPDETYNVEDTWYDHTAN
jgi:hypothetical protein